MEPYPGLSRLAATCGPSLCPGSSSVLAGVIAQSQAPKSPSPLRNGPSVCPEQPLSPAPHAQEPDGDPWSTRQAFGSSPATPAPDPMGRRLSAGPRSRSRKKGLSSSITCFAPHCSCVISLNSLAKPLFRAITLPAIAGRQLKPKEETLRPRASAASQPVGTSLPPVILTAVFRGVMVGSGGAGSGHSLTDS